ncbi:Protein SKIP34 [Bienertia sinuspersici]
MCYNHEKEWRREFDNHTPSPPSAAARSAALLRVRLAETELRLEQARAREDELSCQLLEMKRFISIMEILESYLKRRFREHQAPPLNQT